ncbi:glycosyltransferase [candidate division KSB1 bacterium]|nr:glycosyltransferase [candidate division KSB1 bacterium]
MKKIKIMHVLPSLEIGGMETALITLINGMDTDRFENQIFCFDFKNYENSIQHRLHDENIPIYIFEKGHGVDYWLPIKISRILRKQKIDIVHTRNFAALLYGSIAAKLAGVPGAVADIRGRIPVDEGQKCKRLSFLVSKFVGVSEDIKKMLATDFKIKESKIQTIYNGVQIPGENQKLDIATLRSKLGLAPNDFVIGTIGRTEPVKDYTSLIRMSAPVLQKYRNVKLMIVGDGSQRTELEKLTKDLGVNTQTIFTGYQKEVSNFLRLINLFALTSVSEGISNVLLEAMATSIPVLATEVGGNPEIVRHNQTGFLIPRPNLNQITEKIELLINNPELAKDLGQNGRKWVEEKFTIEKMVSEYQSLYQTIIK